MKHLFLLRHAKSAWDDPALADHDRPLAPRGQRAAPLIAAHMVERDWLPDLVLCSTARRATETLDLVLAGLGRNPPVRHVSGLYLAPPSRILAWLANVADDVSSVLVVAHNPGLANLASRLGKKGDKAAQRHLREKFPTAALAVFALDTGQWREVAAAPARLKAFVRPRDLE